MINEVTQLLERYQAWLKDKTKLREVNDWVEITTPYLDRHNDYIQIYAKRNNGGFVLTDDGYVIRDLEASGCRVDSPRRQELLRLTLNGFGIQQNGQALEVHASSGNFATRKHNLVQAALAVNDLFYLASPNVASVFFEDVEQWLNVHDIRYTPRVKFSGRSGLDHVYDFVIPRSRRQPERILRTINRPNKDSAQALAFSWIDTQEVRSADSEAYAFLNDSDREVAQGVVDALRTYDVHPVLWSKREEVREQLAA